MMMTFSRKDIMEKKSIRLIPKSQENFSSPDYLDIEVKKKTVFFYSCIDDAGNTFKISKDQLKEMLA